MVEKTKNVNNLLFFVKGLAFLFSITENFFNRSPTSCNIMKEARIFVSFIQPLDAASLAPESLLIGIRFVQCNLNFLDSLLVFFIGSDRTFCNNSGCSIRASLLDKAWALTHSTKFLLMLQISDRTESEFCLQVLSTSLEFLVFRSFFYRTGRSLFIFEIMIKMCVDRPVI